MTDLEPAPAKAAGFVRFETLRNRPDFLAAAKARKHATPSMIVQARRRPDPETDPETDADDPPLTRIGFTCSKKVGNAVARNLAKRRLRAAARDVIHRHGLAGWDYVLIGRATVTGTAPYQTLLHDLTQALSKLHPSSGQKYPGGLGAGPQLSKRLGASPQTTNK